MHTSTFDEPRLGRPVEVTTPAINEKIHKMMDHRSKVAKIAQTTRMSAERVCHILHQRLHIEKLCARWLLPLLTIVQKLIWKIVSNKNLARYKLNPGKFLCRFITAD